MEKTLIEDLLTENRYWTFWKSDWSQHIYVFWGGKTNWKEVEKQMVQKLGKGLKFERQVELKEPQIVFK
jgi:hypothetical protein